MSLIDLPPPEWVELLRAEKAKGKSITQIASEIGMPRPSVSMLINGTYPAKSLDLVTRKHGAAVMRLYRDQMMCPHLRRGIPAEDCRRFAAAPMSTSNPEKLRHWGACRACPINPLKGGDDV
ncbi:hypothetical protein C8J27_11097 [Rhodobacter aestuarii]|uniref:Uncharacterized protein n=1 Tax=Rhodobacter aestuarii TaxID=453582 RepID=A0A1N7Q283_9RHOB|nr:helix-turn-helix transcriptional regulator [Rhodobacter aestuarii]PTV94046.1 hypothetical protein C8J27_11097 [Rhodobacter aestuarii]SIT16952.1 hypothetical protein SAMN05421580_11297 [Rhodobacter aestuarii]